MSEEAIRKLRRKFIFYAMLTLSIVMFLIAGLIYIVNLVVTRNEIRETMAFIVENDGIIQDAQYLYRSDDYPGVLPAGDDASDGEGASAGDTENPGDGTTLNSGSDDSAAAGDSEASVIEVTADTAEESSSGGHSGISQPNAKQRERIMDNLSRSVDQNTYDITRFLNDVFGTGSADISDNSEDAFSTRYFAVIYGADDSVEAIIANHISSLTGEEAEALGEYARSRLFHFGQYGVYYYQVSPFSWQGTDSPDSSTAGSSSETSGGAVEEESASTETSAVTNGGTAEGSSTAVESSPAEGTIVVYLDSTNQINSTQRLFYSALILIGFGVIVTFVFVRIFSSRAIAPEIRNAELQKQFITNASHELKTPLAVIRANTEMQEILTGENEWTQSTLRQVDRLNGLIQNLVTITKAQENETEERIPTDVSKIVNDVVETYMPVSQQDGKTMERDIPDGITMKAVDSEIRQLATLLMDNAIKYCDDNGTIRTSVWQRGKETWLSVSNDYAEGKDVDYTKFFERFYRKDEAHTIDSSGKENKGGYGIGLSIAESLVKKYNGTIRADWKDGKITFTCMLR